MNQNPWDFRNRQRTIRKSNGQRKTYEPKPKRERGKRFRFNGYDLHRLEDLPKEHRTAADQLKIGERIEYRFKKPNEYNARLRVIERTF